MLVFFCPMKIHTTWIQNFVGMEISIVYNPYKVVTKAFLKSTVCFHRLFIF